MKVILFLGFVAILFFAGAMFATHASAQYQSQSGQYQVQPGQNQSQSGQHHFQGTRTAVNGTTYTNANYGIQVAIPDGWSGSEIKRTTGATSVTLAPGGFQSMQGGQRPPVTISISMIPKGPTSYTQHFMPRNVQDGETCTNSTSTQTFNSLNFNEVTVDCTGTVTMESQYEMTQTSSAYITFGLRADSDADFNSQATTFDTMLGTLQITNASQNTVTPSQSIVIPSWVKKNAGYWATGQLGDSDFVSGIQYLVQQGIMKIPLSTSTSNSSSQQIPSWVKTNAGWWASGQISDSDFVK
ncbi:MAG: hypothetical protein WCC52_06990 [Nitrosotalea sp.]